MENDIVYDMMIQPTKEEIDAFIERTKLLVKKWGPAMTAPPTTGSAKTNWIEPQQKIDI